MLCIKTFWKESSAFLLLLSKAAICQFGSRLYKKFYCKKCCIFWPQRSFYKLVILLVKGSCISARAGWDTRSIFKRSLTGLNSEFSSSLTSHYFNIIKFSLLFYIPRAGERILRFITFRRVLMVSERQTSSCRIWTQISVSISYDIKNAYWIQRYICLCLLPDRTQVQWPKAVITRI